MDSWPLGMGLLGCPVTLVRNYHYSLRINPEECSSHLFRSGSLKSRKCLHVSGVFMEVWSASCPCYVCIEVIEVLVMRVYAFSIPGIPLSLSLCVLYAFWQYAFGDKKNCIQKLSLCYIYLFCSSC